MDIKCYLAMTAAEFSAAATVPEHIAWMACHFSCYGTGLSNLPRQLPDGAMVIINDRTPVQGHDPVLITEQLTQLAEEQKVSCFLLDFQRPNIEESAKIAQVLTQKLPCPVGVTELYAKELICPVFLEPSSLHDTLEAHLAPWNGREIWLEAATEAEVITVTTQGSQFEMLSNADLIEPVFWEEALHCRYHIDLRENCAVFTLLRGKQEAAALLEEAQKLGVKQAVGLYQQLGKDFPVSPLPGDSNS